MKSVVKAKIAQNNTRVSERGITVKIPFMNWLFEKWTRLTSVANPGGYGGPQLSRQNQKPHGKNKIPHDKTKTLTAKPKTSRQNQILHSKNQIPHGKSKYPRQNQSYFAFAVKYLVLPWGFWFCREVFCFCREVFGFAVMFLILPWSFWFCRASCGPPYRGGSRALLFVRPNWAPKGGKNFFLVTAPPLI